MQAKSNDNNTEKAILMAAKEIFLNKGYQLATTTEIAQQAGVTHAMLHYYFRTKDNLFVKVFEHYAHLFMDSLSFLLNEDMPLTQKITFGIETHFDLIAAHPKLPYFIVSEIINNHSNIHHTIDLLFPYYEQILSKLEQNLQQEAQSGHIRYISAQNLIYDIICLNVFAYIGMPVVKNLNAISQEAYKDFVAQRKAENVRTILNLLTLEQNHDN